MLSIKFHYRPSVRTGMHEGRLFLRLIYRRSVKEITTSYRIYPEEWDADRSSIRLPKDNPQRENYLSEVMDRMRRDLEYLNTLAERMSQREDFSLPQLVELYRSIPPEGSLMAFAQRLSSSLKEQGQERTARAYLSSVRALLNFAGRNDLKLEDIRARLIKEFQSALLEAGRQMNTVSFYMRNLRSIYNRAVRIGLITAPQENPFQHAYTGVATTRKRALSKEEMALLSELEIKLLPDKKKSNN